MGLREEGPHPHRQPWPRPAHPDTGRAEQRSTPPDLTGQPGLVVW